MPRLTLGLDCSTQSLTAVLFDADRAAVVREHSVSYRFDPRLAGFGIDPDECILPPSEPGEADQPPLLFLAALDVALSDLRAQGHDLGEVEAVDVSGQQHGHVYLGGSATAAFARLRDSSAGATPLADLLADAFSHGSAPIWKTSSTASEAEALRSAAGGRQAMIARTGSDSPLRFTGAVVRRVGRRFPEAYAATARIHLISSLLPAVLAGDRDVPTDFGNAAGTSLMDYRARRWDRHLLEAAAEGLPGGAAALESKLPALAHPLAVVGRIAPYFVVRHGFRPSCRVVAGSGDNPQSKVLADGDLLSLGTSFVIMAATAEGTIDPTGAANAMYDGLGRPFLFGCRTNGALVWDRARALHGIAPRDFEAGRSALRSVVPGEAIRLWQPDDESFPLSPPFALVRRDEGPADFAHDFAGLVDSALVLVWNLARTFSANAMPENDMNDGAPLGLVGGPARDPEIVRRVAALWRRPVRVLGGAGAAQGAAVAAAAALLPVSERAAALARWRAAAADESAVVAPEPALVDAFHRPNGGVARVLAAFAEATRPEPLRRSGARSDAGIPSPA